MQKSGFAFDHNHAGNTAHNGVGKFFRKGLLLSVLVRRSPAPQINPFRILIEKALDGGCAVMPFNIDGISARRRHGRIAKQQIALTDPVRLHAWSRWQ